MVKRIANRFEAHSQCQIPSANSPLTRRDLFGLLNGGGLLPRFWGVNIVDSSFEDGSNSDRLLSILQDISVNRRSVPERLVHDHRDSLR